MAGADEYSGIMSGAPCTVPFDSASTHLDLAAHGGAVPDRQSEIDERADEPTVDVLLASADRVVNMERCPARHGDERRGGAHAGNPCARGDETLKVR